MFNNRHIKIRQYKSEDIQPFFEAVRESISEVSPWLPWCHESYSIEDTRQWVEHVVPALWKSGKGYEFVMVALGSRQILGGCCLEQLGLADKSARIGYWVRSGAAGRGVATAACRLLCDFGFGELGLRRIEIITSIENPASLKVGSKMPYSEKRTVKNGFSIRGKISDAVVYLILNSRGVAFPPDTDSEKVSPPR